MKTTQFALFFFSNYPNPEPPVSHRNVRRKFCKALKEPMVSKTGKKLGANKMFARKSQSFAVDGDDGDGYGDDGVRFLNQLPESLKSMIFIK